MSCLLLSSCSQSKQTLKLTFPSHEFGKTDSNAQIYEIDPFILNIKLPKVWDVVVPDSEDEAISGFSTVAVYDHDKYVCSISYNTFTSNKNTNEENFYRYVYNQLMLGSIVTWDNNYTVVKKDDNSSTATCDVTVNSPQAKFEFPGILSYDISVLTYIMISFENCEVDVTQKTINDIAKSILLTR